MQQQNETLQFISRMNKLTNVFTIKLYIRKGALVLDIHCTSKEVCFMKERHK